MHSKAHNIFAMGISSMLGFFCGLYLKLSFFNFIFVVALSGVLGMLSDIDLLLGKPHRGETHESSFILLWSLVFTFIIYIITGYLQLYIGSNSLTGWDLDESVSYFPIPILSMSFLLDLGCIWGCLFFGGLTHLVLDQITIMGLPGVMGDQYEGKVRSNNIIANGGFILLGFILLIFGVVGFIFVVTLKSIDPFWFIIVSISLSILIIIVIISMIRKKEKYIPEITYNGEINGIKMVSIGDPCINIKDKKICFD